MIPPGLAVDQCLDRLGTDVEPDKVLRTVLVGTDWTGGIRGTLRDHCDFTGWHESCVYCSEPWPCPDRVRAVVSLAAICEALGVSTSVSWSK